MVQRNFPTRGVRMEARSVAAAMRPVARPGGVVLTAVLLGVLTVASWYVLEYALPYIALDPAEYQAKTLIHGVSLFLHVAAGVVAILIGPFQLHSGLRRRTLRFHRLGGRIYLGAVALGALAAGYILTLPGASLNFRLGIAGLAIAWVGTTGLAYMAILKKRIDLHQEWMIRSYVVTFGFVVFRAIVELLMAAEAAPPGEIIAAASWGCWAFPLLLTEFIMQGRKVLRAHGPGAVAH